MRRAPPGPAGSGTRSGRTPCTCATSCIAVPPRSRAASVCPPVATGGRRALAQARAELEAAREEARRLRRRRTPRPCGPAASSRRPCWRAGRRESRVDEILAGARAIGWRWTPPPPRRACGPVAPAQRRVTRAGQTSAATTVVARLSCRAYASGWADTCTAWPRR
ncbi:hypothetical protein V2I01_40355 [Micromonospora sp. BRA006-A]|nr:hypothetical protein [Micromonospora sp. BRA006-A]